MYGSVVAVNSN